jgi:hypothetical protein
MANLGRFRISFPDESAINADRNAAIAYVRPQIEQAIESVSARTSANISDAMLDFVCAPRRAFWWSLPAHNFTGSGSGLRPKA